MNDEDFLFPKGIQMIKDFDNVKTVEATTEKIKEGLESMFDNGWNRDQVKESIKKSLSNLADENVLHNDNKVKCSMLWDRFSFKTKFKWYIYNEFFKFLGII